MEYEETKEKFKSFFIQNGCEILEENDDKLVFKYLAEGFSFSFQVDRENIEAYNNVNSSYKVNHPTDCSIMNDNYREVLIDFTTYRDTLDERSEIFFGDKENIYIRIGRASNNFMIAFLLNKNLFNYSKLFTTPEDEEDQNILEFYDSPFTISIYNLSQKNEDERIKFSDNMFETCLFQLANFKNICTEIIIDWNKYYEELEVDYDYEDILEQKFDLPKVFYNKDLIRYYILGKSSAFNTHEFLAFYQILEYFFIQVSDENLYEKLSYEIKDPSFKPKDHYLAKLVRIMKGHSRKTNETEMLKNVLKKFTDYEDLKKFIEDYEEEIGEYIYTKINKIFGEEMVVNLEEGHIYGNIAKIIKIIRNALVHSSDIYGYERQERYIPFSESEEIVEKHIPLIKFLAEKVLFATSQFI